MKYDSLIKDLVSAGMYEEAEKVLADAKSALKTLQTMSRALEGAETQKLADAFNKLSALVLQFASTGQKKDQYEAALKGFSKMLESEMRSGSGSAKNQLMRVQLHLKQLPSPQAVADHTEAEHSGVMKEARNSAMRVIREALSAANRMGKPELSEKDVFLLEESVRANLDHIRNMAAKAYKNPRGWTPQMVKVAVETYLLSQVLSRK